MLSALIHEAMVGEEVRPHAKENSHWFFQKVYRALLMKELTVGTQRWTDTSVHSYGSPDNCTDVGLSTHSHTTVVPSGLKMSWADGTLTWSCTQTRVCSVD